MTGMDPEQLRRSIARATIPLLAESETLTTARIARAAGVGEADLLAVFADTEAVMRACVAMLAEAASAALDPAREVREIDAIPADQPLASRLIKVIDIVDAYYRRVRTDLDDLVADLAPAAGTTDPHGVPPSDRQDGLRGLGRSVEFRQAVARVLVPDQHSLRLPVDVLAEVFVGMTTGGVRPVPPDRAPLPAEQIVDLFLHGAVNAA